jgi:hypothetical protein
MIKKQWEFLKDISALIHFIAENGLTATGGELWRTKEQQSIYVKKGLSKTMNSLHLTRLAIDLNFFDTQGNLIECPQMVGDYWETLSPENEWGGNWSFKDYGHFQRNL